MTSRLVVGPNWIGDSVMSLPVVRAIRAADPGGRLAVLAPSGPAAVYRAEGSADTILLRSGLLSDALRLRRERFQESWLLPNSFRSALAPFLAGVPARIGYSTDRRGALLTHALPQPRRTMHQLRDYDALLLFREIEPDLDEPRLPIPPAARSRALRALEAAGIAPSDRLVLLAPASAKLAEKRWPVERYAELAGRLSGAGYACAAVIGPQEGSLGVRLRNLARTPLPALGEDLDPVELAAVLALACAVAANDSGPMHLASAVGAAVVGLFGPTDPARTGPSGTRTRVVKRRSMNEITVEEVFEAVLEVSS